MKQYLLSVHMVEGEPEPAPEEMQKAYTQVDAFNAEVQAEGAWVFAGGLHPAEHRHGGASAGRRGDHHRRSVRRDQGAARRLLGHRGRRPRRRAGVGRQGVRGLHGPGRGAPVPGRARPSRGRGRPPTAAELERIFREESGRAVATLVRLFGDIDIAEEAVQEAFVVAAAAVAGDRAAAQPGRVDHHHRPQPGDRPAAPGGVPRRPPRPGRAPPRARRTARAGWAP